MVQITDDGKLCVADYKSIYRAILTVLYDGPKRLLELVKNIRSRFHEFKYIEDTIIIHALGELIKQKLVISTYTEEW